MAKPDSTSESTPNSRRLSFYKNEIVTLLIGPDEQELAVHENCLASNSEFFKAALKKEWTEDKTRIIKLPDEKCLDTFVSYLNFVYHGKLPTEENTTKASGGDYMLLVRIYVLGERMLDKSVQHAVIREIMRLPTLAGKDGMIMYPGPWAITSAYEGTCVGSPIRRLLVDLRVVGVEEKWPNSKNPGFLADFSEALVKAIFAQKTVRDFQRRVLVAEDYFT